MELFFMAGVALFVVSIGVLTVFAVASTMCGYPACVSLFPAETTEKIFNFAYATSAVASALLIISIFFHI